MISYAEALSLIERTAEAQGLPTELVSLESCLGLRARGEIRSREAQPGFDNSAMDGFAVRAEECAAGSVLEVLGSVAAGEVPAFAAKKNNSCMEIMTGAPLPSGFDSVIPIEHVEVLEGAIRAGREVKLGENVRRAGEDFRQGALLLADGEAVGPEHLLALGAAGAASVRVSRRPKVAVISTGNELAEVSETTLAPGAIRNSSAPFLISSLRAAGVEAEYLGIVRDSDPGRLIELLKGLIGSQSADLVITTGAVSMGRYDFIPEAVRALEGREVFHKTAIRPGKPVLFATLASGRLSWFGLPGNPVSTAVGFRFFVLPFLRSLAGNAAEQAERLPLRAGVRKPEGLRCFLLARRSGNEVEVIPAQASFKVSPLLGANCWVVLKESGTQAEAGAEVDVFPFSGRIGAAS